MVLSSAEAGAGRRCRARATRQWRRRERRRAIEFHTRTALRTNAGAIAGEFFSRMASRGIRRFPSGMRRSRLSEAARKRAHVRARGSRSRGARAPADRVDEARCRRSRRRRSRRSPRRAPASKCRSPRPAAWCGCGTQPLDRACDPRDVGLAPRARHAEARHDVDEAVARRRDRARRAPGGVVGATSSGIASPSRWNAGANDVEFFERHVGHDRADRSGCARRRRRIAPRRIARSD